MGFEKSHMILYLYLWISVGPVQKGVRLSVIRMSAITKLFNFYILFTKPAQEEYIPKTFRYFVSWFRKTVSLTHLKWGGRGDIWRERKEPMCFVQLNEEKRFSVLTTPPPPSFGRTHTREDWTVYKGPSFLVGLLIRLYASPLPPLPSVIWTEETHRKTEKERQFAEWRGGERMRAWRKKESLVLYEQGVTKRCRLTWLTNCALVYEPKCGGGGGTGC